jgi:hypothetical protein
VRLTIRRFEAVPVLRTVHSATIGCPSGTAILHAT